MSGIQDIIATASDSMAHAIAFAMQQPSDVDVDEIVIRLAGQDF